MIVTIDGPAGAGKSSIAKRLAKELGFEFLDTGAMYRAVTVACKRKGIRLEDSLAVAKVAQEATIEFRQGTVWIDGDDVTQEIRDPAINQDIKLVADNPEVRSSLVAAQVKWAENKNAVTEGRDQGTVAFPSAGCKIFLTASPEERARRRFRQLQEKGIECSYEVILDSQIARDRDDRSRPVGALVKAPDAIEVDTDKMSEDEVLDHLLKVVAACSSK